MILERVCALKLSCKEFTATLRRHLDQSRHDAQTQQDPTSHDDVAVFADMAEK